MLVLFKLFDNARFLKPGQVQEMKVHPQSKGNTQFYNTKTEETFRFDWFLLKRLN